MNIYTYSEARQNLASVLDAAKKEGKVVIKTKDGSVFILSIAEATKSPLDVKGVKTDITTEEMLSFIRESRQA